MSLKQLGHFDLPESFEFDLAVQERYQSFSTETLRLSLLGIAAVGFLVANVFMSEEFPIESLDVLVKNAINFALLSFGLAVIFSLIHRYCVVDMLSWQMQSLRRDIAAKEHDGELADKFTQAAQTDALNRFRRYELSRIALTAAVVFLATGGLCLVYAFSKMLSWIGI